MHRPPLELVDFELSQQGQTSTVTPVLEGEYGDGECEDEEGSTGSFEGSSDGEDEEESAPPREGDVDMVYQLPAELADLQQQDRHDELAL